MIDFDTFQTLVMSQVAAWMPKVAGALAVLVLGWFFAGWAKRLAHKTLERAKVDEILLPFVAGMVHVLIIAMVAVAAITTMGVNTTSFVAVLGAAGLAVALAFQSTFSNFAAGVIATDSRVLDDPESVVAVSEMGDSSVNLVVRPWVNTDEYWATRFDLIRALKENLEAAGCTIPYPQRDVHMHTAE